MPPKRQRAKSTPARHRTSDPSRGRPKAGRNSGQPSLADVSPNQLRIIGGNYRGRLVQYSGDRTTRPMKDSVRENLFNVLGKSGVAGSIAWDLFSGTGVLGMEAVSRGAARAVCVEWNRPAAKTIKASAEQLGMSDSIEVAVGDAFRTGPDRMAREQDDTPWLAFFCPPYAFWLEKEDQMVSLIRWVAGRAPLGSVLVTESDQNWDTARLPGNNWDIRQYGHTRLGFFEPELICGMDPDCLPD